MTFLFGSEKGASLLCHYGDKFETGDTDTDCGARPVVAGQRARWWCDAVMYRLGRLQSGCIPTVHCSAGSGRVPAHCALTTGPSSGPPAQSVAVRAWPQQHRTAEWAASLRTCYEHSLENFGLDKWQPGLGPPGASCQVKVDLHPGDCQGKRIVFSFCSRWLDKTLWKCSSQWIMFYITCTLTGLSEVKLVTCCCFSPKCTSTGESFRGQKCDCVWCQCCCNVLTCPDNGSDCRFESLGNGSCRD